VYAQPGGASILAERVNRDRPSFEEVLSYPPEAMIDLLGRDIAEARPGCALLALGTLKGAVKTVEMNGNCGPRAHGGADPSATARDCAARRGHGGGGWRGGGEGGGVYGRVSGSVPGQRNPVPKSIMTGIPTCRRSGWYTTPEILLPGFRNLSVRHGVRSKEHCDGRVARLEGGYCGSQP